MKKSGLTKQSKNCPKNICEPNTDNAENRFRHEHSADLFATKSKYRLIFDNLIAGKFQLVISSEILSEYIEILERKTNSFVANNVAELLLTLRSVQKAEVYYRWNLVKSDADDNKFVDCAISANADFIVSNDKHFDELKKIEFPRIKIINSEDF